MQRAAFPNEHCHFVHNETLRSLQDVAEIIAEETAVYKEVKSFNTD